MDHRADHPAARTDSRLIRPLVGERITAVTALAAAAAADISEIPTIQVMSNSERKAHTTSPPAFAPGGPISIAVEGWLRKPRDRPGWPKELKGTLRLMEARQREPAGFIAGGLDPSLELHADGDVATCQLGNGERMRHQFRERLILCHCLLHLSVNFPTGEA